MVELVDTLVSGTSAVKSMEVRVFFWAMLRRCFLLFLAVFPVSALSAQDGGENRPGFFPVAFFLEAAENAAEGCWMPDWPLDFPPDAFMADLSGVASITLNSGGNKYSFRLDAEGRVLEFPFLYEGTLVQAVLDHSEGGAEGAMLRVAYLADPGGRGYLLSIEVLEYREAYPYLLRVYRNGIYSFVLLGRGNNFISEAWFDEEGVFLGGYEHSLRPASFAPFGLLPKMRIEVTKSIQGGEDDLVRFSFDSRSLVTGIRGREGDFFIQYFKEKLPRYWDRRPAEIRVYAGSGGTETPAEFQAPADSIGEYGGDSATAEKPGRYSLQWDEKNLLVRLYGSHSGEGDTVDRRYEYTFDEKGNWIERREIRMSSRYGYLASGMGPLLSRTFEYRELSGDE